jgi:hypothetical protein
VQLIEKSDTLQHLNIERMALSSRVKMLIWPLYKSTSIQSFHLSDNGIPDMIISNILFVFGIKNIDDGDGDLFDASST